jgi:psiF repeat
MKHFVTALAIAAAVIAPAAFAKDATPQQAKMKACSTENKGKKGDEYKTAMKSCLSADAAASAPMAAAPAASSAKTTQQEKMKTCAGTNKGKKGAEYKAAMKECLSS